jgi:hypothetical protein
MDSSLDGVRAVKFFMRPDGCHAALYGTSPDTEPEFWIANVYWAWQCPVQAELEQKYTPACFSPAVEEIRSPLGREQIEAVLGPCCWQHWTDSDTQDPRLLEPCDWLASSVFHRSYIHA